jgi:hypothetical protein
MDPNIFASKALQTQKKLDHCIFFRKMNFKTAPKIKCVCGETTIDTDRFYIQCSLCLDRQHYTCDFPADSTTPSQEFPDEYRCKICSPSDDDKHHSRRTRQRSSQLIKDEQTRNEEMETRRKVTGVEKPAPLQKSNM